MRIVSGIMLTLLLLGMLTLAFNIQLARSEPTTWTVDDDGPADFHTIQDAINAASPGDIIFVHSGTYYEHLVVDKNISLVGGSRSTTVIDGSRNGTVISVIADYVSISGFTIQNGYHIPHVTYGIKIGEWNDGANNVTVEDNIILDNDIGIFVYYSSNSTILDNLVFNNYEGIDIVLSNDNHIERNSLFNNTVGIAVGSGGNSNMIRENEMSNSDVGIQVGWSINNYIVGNIISLNAYAGIRFDSSSNNSIIGNTITSSNRDGIVLFGSNSNTIRMNEIIQNKWDGIAVWYSNANIIYYNNFLNNTKQAGSYSGSTNIWDDGYPSGGNYWSDYEKRCPDAEELDGSGIWDTPYDIDENNQDNYPLMEPWSPEPQNPVEATQELIENIETWNLHKGTENSLKAKLKAAIHMLDGGKEDGAIRKLTAFINRVEMLREKTLTNEQADYLIAEAQRIINLING